MGYKFRHTLEKRDTFIRKAFWDGDKDFKSLVAEAWAQYCEDKGWSSDIQDGYTVYFRAFDNNKNEVYQETFGE